MAAGQAPAGRASIQGGWDRGGNRRGSFGVRVFIGTPEQLEAELDSMARLTERPEG